MTGILVMAASGKTKQLVATINAGASNSGNGTSFGWSNNVAVTGGSGSYTYAWALSGTSGGTWSLSGPTLVGTNISVTGVSDVANATVTCTVTDTVTGRVAVSNSSAYQFLHNSG